MTHIPIVHCLKCNRPVNMQTQEVDEGNGRWVVTVICHGEREQTFIPFALAHDGPLNVVHAEAFGDKARLEHQP